MMISKRWRWWWCWPFWRTFLHMVDSRPGKWALSGAWRQSVIGNDLLMILMMVIFMMIMMIMMIMMMKMVTNEFELPVIKWVGTFWVTVRPTHPTFDGMACKCEFRNALILVPRWVVDTWKYSKSKNECNAQVDGHCFARRQHSVQSSLLLKVWIALLPSSLSLGVTFSPPILLLCPLDGKFVKQPGPSQTWSLVSLNWISWQGWFLHKQVAVGAVCPRSQHLRRSYLLLLVGPAPQLPGVNCLKDDLAGKTKKTSATHNSVQPSQSSLRYKSKRDWGRSSSTWQYYTNATRCCEGLRRIPLFCWSIGTR